MKFSNNAKFAFAFFLFSSPFLLACSQSGSEHEFNYEEGTGRGASRWGTLKPEWITCSAGQHQSPINIRTVQLNSQLRDLQRNYTFARAVLRNGTVNVEVNFTGNAGSITINGIVYRAENIHWHSPSEHTLDGIRFPLEVHIVHRSDQNDIAVVSFLYRYGLPDLFIATILPNIVLLRQTDRGVGLINPESVGFPGSSYYRYNGSLTVPPCTEGVVWTVFQKIKQVSRSQVEALRNVLPPQNRNNSRPTQPLNNRDVLFRPGGAASLDNISNP
ncbi:alpha carbonic anhydrase 7, A. THALIANA ALPHA CARBONIC ANHYDRASE 7 [Hibiscus trionum]|uniref:Carbonic anhydrase n=1 Tax=Hibiscus trionum TaxID=183268 RepID=A0A9W7J6C2_HIBTR|nr:alpha carbonic anhydrase 7, A. THALIANA ALPHA CARBONIC ANHYDRASE 7 [Hibiscus trionum]